MIKKGLLAVCFGLASAGYTAAANAECCADPYRASPADLSYRPLGSAGIVIPAHNQKVLGDGRIQFEIHSDDFSTFEYLLSRTMAIYQEGRKPDDSRACPYINIAEEFITREDLGNGVIRVTMQISPAILQIAQRQGCVITDTPAP